MKTDYVRRRGCSEDGRPNDTLQPQKEDHTVKENQQDDQNSQDKEEPRLVAAGAEQQPIVTDDLYDQFVQDEDEEELLCYRCQASSHSLEGCLHQDGHLF